MLPNGQHQHQRFSQNSSDIMKVANGVSDASFQCIQWQHIYVMTIDTWSCSFEFRGRFIFLVFCGFYFLQWRLKTRRKIVFISLWRKWKIKKLVRVALYQWHKCRTTLILYGKYVYNSLLFFLQFYLSYLYFCKISSVIATILYLNWRGHKRNFQEYLSHCFQLASLYCKIVQLFTKSSNER